MVRVDLVNSGMSPAETSAPLPSHGEAAPRVWVGRLRAVAGLPDSQGSLAFIGAAGRGERAGSVPVARG
ncbi:MAG: hypothetical protein IT208_02615 [Chthonomonadales bacterium]|nr:hypothetical protein [Chthonomonadales bacterium]